MSLLNTIHITEKTHNGILWGTLFGITMIPIQFGIHHKLIKKLNTNEEFKYKLSKETFKLLFMTSSLIGFLYGYNTSRKLTNYLTRLHF